MVIDFDDFGCDKVISDQCRTRDCRDELDRLHYANPNFKVTLFTVPAYVTIELYEWLIANESWVEVAMHGYDHLSNYECSEWSYETMEGYTDRVNTFFPGLFTKGFKAPGWQISEGCYEWLKDNGWWVADQAYNNERRPEGLRAYINDNGDFSANGVKTLAFHGHTYDTCGNGITERFDELLELVKRTEEFSFVSEILS